MSENTKPAARISRQSAAILVAGLTVIALTIGGSWLRSGKSPSAYEREARTAIARRDFVAATESLEHVVRIAPQQTSAWLLLAENAARTGQSARACEALETAAQFEPTKTGKLAVQLGRRWMTNNDIQPAIRALRVAPVAVPQSPDAYRLLAQIYGVIGNRHEVVRCLIELLKRNSFTRSDLIVLTSVNPAINDPHRLQAMLQTNPADKSPLLPLAMQELDQNNIENARKLLVEIVTADADNDEAQGILGELLAEFLPGEFLAWHGRLSSRADENARIWLARAKWLNAQGHAPEGVRCLLETLAREPENLSAAALVEQLLKSLGDGQAAEFYTERSRHLQRILDLSERMTEPRADVRSLAAFSAAAPFRSGAISRLRSNRSGCRSKPGHEWVSSQLSA